MIDVLRLISDMAKMQVQRPDFARLQNMNPQVIGSLIIAQAIDRLTDAITQATSSGRNPLGDTPHDRSPEEILDDIRSIVGQPRRLPADSDDRKSVVPDGAPFEPVDEPL